MKRVCSLCGREFDSYDYVRTDISYYDNWYSIKARPPCDMSPLCVPHASQMLAWAKEKYNFNSLYHKPDYMTKFEKKIEINECEFRHWEDDNEKWNNDNWAKPDFSEFDYPSQYAWDIAYCLYSAECKRFKDKYGGMIESGIHFMIPIDAALEWITIKLNAAANRIKKGLLLNFCEHEDCAYYADYRYRGTYLCSKHRRGRVEMKKTKTVDSLMFKYARKIALIKKDCNDEFIL